MRKISLLFIIVFLFIFFCADVFAQEEATSSGMAYPTLISGDNIESQKIVCSTSQGYALCENEYVSSIYGIVTNNPSRNIGQLASNNEYFVVNEGIAEVLVSLDNGDILEGDLITSSEIPGVGMKATKNGYVLGNALTSLTDVNENNQGTVFVSINIHPATIFTDSESNLIELLRKGLSSVFLTPISALRYLLASLVTIISFILAFIYFGRLAKTGVESIARNPLAKRTIQLTLFVNFLITFVIFAAGLFIAYLILAI